MTTSPAARSWYRALTEDDAPSHADFGRCSRRAILRMCSASEPSKLTLVRRGPEMFTPSDERGHRQLDKHPLFDDMPVADSNNEVSEPEEHEIPRSIALESRGALMPFLPV